MAGNSNALDNALKILVSIYPREPRIDTRLMFEDVFVLLKVEFGSHLPCPALSANGSCCELRIYTMNTLAQPGQLDARCGAEEPRLIFQLAVHRSQTIRNTFAKTIVFCAIVKLCGQSGAEANQLTRACRFAQ